MRSILSSTLAIFAILSCLPCADAQTDLREFVSRVRELKRQAASCPDGGCFKEAAASLAASRPKSLLQPVRSELTDGLRNGLAPLRDASIPGARMSRQTLNSVWFAMNYIGETIAFSLCLGTGRTDETTTELLRSVLERARPHLQAINRTEIVTFDLGLLQGVSDRMAQSNGEAIGNDLVGLFTQYSGQLEAANISCCQLNDGPVLGSPIIPNLASVATTTAIAGGIFACFTCSDTVSSEMVEFYNSIIESNRRDMAAVQGCLTGTAISSLLRPVSATGANQTAYLTYLNAIRDVSQTLLANDCVCDLSSRVNLPPPPVSLLGVFTGRVVAAATQAPISGATVAVGSGGPTTRTAADGTYRLAGVAPGNVALTASATGFLAVSRSLEMPESGEVTANFSLATAPVATGTLTGVIRNASSGSAISGARITLSNSTLSDISAVNGAFRIPGVPVGNVVVTATLAGFAPATFNATVTANGTTNVNLSISPVLATGQIRITLNWLQNGSGQPRDLDMHLYGPREGSTSCFSVSFASPGFLGSNPYAQLEVDNIQLAGSPPTETIRIARLFPGTYTLFINNYSGGANLLSQSQAQIAVFRENQQISTVTVPAGPEEVWNVLTIDGTTGQITMVNQMRTTAPPLACR
jgi:hypothetical protein